MIKGGSMSTERSEAREHISVTMQAQASVEEGLTAASDKTCWDVFTIACYNAAGELVWREETVQFAVDRGEPYHP
jgi:hypothetical protein